MAPGSGALQMTLFMMLSNRLVTYILFIYLHFMLLSETHSLYAQMTQHNVGALVVVKSGENKSIAGIITERGIIIIYLSSLLYMSSHSFLAHPL